MDSVSMSRRIADVFKNNVGFRDYFLTVYQDRNLFVKRVELQEKRALVKGVFFQVLVINTLEFQSPFNPPGKWANTKSQKLRDKTIKAYLCRLVFTSTIYNIWRNRNAFET
jgi:hypothetical protein